MSGKTDHDQIFKTLIKEFFKEFLDGFLPEVAAEINFDSGAIRYRIVSS